LLNMPKGHRNENDNPSFVITAKMNINMSKLENEAWEIWQDIDRRKVIDLGFTSKAELLATALIQWQNGIPEARENATERLLRQILSKLNSGGFVQAPTLTDDEKDVLVDFAQNRQMLEDMIGDE
jgi:hypothetical protein